MSNQVQKVGVGSDHWLFLCFSVDFVHGLVSLLVMCLQFLLAY